MHRQDKLASFSQFTSRILPMEGVINSEVPHSWTRVTVCLQEVAAAASKRECYVQFLSVKLNPKLSLKVLTQSGVLPTSLLLKMEVYRELFVVTRRRHRGGKRQQYIISPETCSVSLRGILTGCLFSTAY